MGNNDEKVTLSRSDYDDLVAADVMLDMIESMIFVTAKLSYDKERMRFSDDAINAIMKASFPIEYSARLDMLKKEAKDGTDKD